MTGLDALPEACDLVIVGAGPAGLAAALAAARTGLVTVVADENRAPGGQVWRGVLDSPFHRARILGEDYAAGRTLAEAFQGCAAMHAPETTVWLLARDDDAGRWQAGLSRDGKARILSARAVLIATGALERPFPVPGWTLPGVMTAGAAQTLLKASGMIAEAPVVLAGTGPLTWLLAAQYARAGAPLAAILDTTPRANWRRALPHLPAFLASPYLLKGMRLLREARRAGPVIRGVTAIAAHGDGALAEVRYVAGGRSASLAARTLLLHQGVTPQIHLAMAAGVPHRWNGGRLCFEPDCDAEGRTARPGLFIAGDGAGIGGVDAARWRGFAAAEAIATDLGRADPAGAGRRAAATKGLARVLRGRAFLDALYRPADAFRMPADDVIVCRCEEVTAGDIRAATAMGAQGPNQMKAFGRAGMGPCQGRLCGLTVTEIMAAASGRTPAAIGHFRLRPPVKPITVGEWASLAEARFAAGDEDA